MAVPTGVEFHPQTLRRVGRRGDNFCVTWAGDDSQVTSMDDGDWLGGNGVGFSHRLYRIRGEAADFDIEDLTGYPRFAYREAGWFGYGIAAVDGVLYSLVSKCPKHHWSGPFRGVKLLVSRDDGATWARVDARGGERPLRVDDEARNAADPAEMFFWEEGGVEAHGGVAWPFGCGDFLQCGRDGADARDGYLYIYSPEGAQTHRLLLARVPRDAVTRRDAWEFFAGRDGAAPRWSAQLADRTPIHQFPQATSAGHVFGWYSWLPSVVWNPGLGRYLMVSGGTVGGHGMTADADDYYHAWMHARTGSLGLWHAAEPWGPWQPIHYDEAWTVDAPGNRTYQPKLSPKWISDDGRRMVLIWSDAMKNEEGRSHTVNYRWNQMEISLKVG